MLAIAPRGWPLVLGAVLAAVASGRASECLATGAGAGACAPEDTQQRELAADPGTTSLLQVSRVEQLRSAAAAGEAGRSEDSPRLAGPSPARLMLGSDPMPSRGRAAATAAGLSQSGRQTYSPGGSNTYNLWRLAGKWENLIPTSGFCLVSSAYERKDQLQLGQGITFQEQITFEKVRQSVRDRTFEVDGDGLVDLWLEGVYYIKISNTSRTSSTAGNSIYVREEYLEADPNASRDNPVEPDPLLHLETGQWLSLSPEENTTAPRATPRLTTTRLASIPHGNSLVASGSYSYVECASDPDHCMDGEYKRLAQQYSSAPLNYDCDATALAKYYSVMEQKYGSEYARNPVAFLANATRGLRVHGFAKWEVSTLAQQEGEGLVNVPFLERQVHPSAFNSTFYVLSVDADDGSHYDLIQYIEGLYFDVVMGCDGTRAKFPHLNANTLKRVQSAA